jgi:FkbM family methyltransferase
MLFFKHSIYPRIANRLGLLPFINVGYQIKVLKSRFRVPVLANKVGMNDHLTLTEPYVLEIFRRLNENSKFVFLDVGVNFGQTLIKIKSVNPDIPYIGFEPSGICGYYTSLLIKVNKIKNAQLIRCALSDAYGVLPLYSGGEGDTMASLIEYGPRGGSGFKELVPTVPLDNLTSIILESGDDFILKIDVEGAESMVLNGARNFLMQHRPVVVFECLPSGGLPQKIQDHKSVSDFFAEVNYSLFLLNEQKHQPEKIESIVNTDDFNATNYIAVPEERQSILSCILN